MPLSPMEWQLSEMEPGSEIIVKDEAGRLVARGLLRDDRLSLVSPTGEQVSLRGHPDWTVTLLKAPPSRRR